MLTPDDRLKRAMKWTVVMFILFLIFLSVANAKELPEIVRPSQLGSTWDDRRVAIFGYARFCEYMQGRMGSNYIRCVVEGVDVYLDFKVWGVVDEQVIVTGIYREHGRFGGLLADHFVIADALVRDWK